MKNLLKRGEAFDQWTTDLLDSISNGICIVNKEYNVEFWNDYMQFYTGIGREEILGNKIDSYFPEFGKEFYRENIDLIFSGWPPLFYSSRLNHLFTGKSSNKEKSPVYQDVTITSLPGKSENEYCALITVNDVTDLNRKLEERNYLYNKAQEEIEMRHQTEKKLRESESELRELNGVKDRLISIIAHDLRSPISTNISGLEAIMDNYDFISDEIKKNLLKVLLDGTRNTLDLLEDLLSWAKSNSRTTKLERSIFSISLMIEDELVQMLPTARNKGIRVSLVDLEDVEVNADKNMIRTVFRNLFTNAVKFTRVGGEIVISLNISDNQVYVHVRDNGIGMDAEGLGKLFKPDQISSTSGTNNEKGSGFGLILAKEFMEKNQGTLSAESVKGEGSTFTFSLPLG